MTTPLADPDRLRAVRAMGHGASLRDDPAFDRLARVAARLLGAPMAAVTLVDDTRQLLLGWHGAADGGVVERERPLEQVWCRLVVGEGVPLVLDDARHDPRTRDSYPLRVLGAHAYVGIPLRDGDGHVVGTLFALDQVPRAWDAGDVALLDDHARSVMDHLMLRRVRAAEAAQRERLAELLDTTDDLVCTTGADGRIDYVNRAWRETLGYGLEEARRMQPWEMVAREHLARYREAALRLVSGETIDDFEAVLIAVDGRRVVCRGRAVPEMRGTRCVATRAVYRNVTAVQQLDAVRGRLLSTFEVTPDAVALFSRDGRLVFLNRAARAFAGLGEHDSLADVRIWDLLDEPTQERLAFEGIPEAQRQGSWHGELAMRLAAAEGDAIPGVGTLVAHPSTIPNDAPYFLSMVFVDLREARAVEAERRAALARVARVKDELIALVSHELRQPLGAIRGALRLLANSEAPWRAAMDERDAALLAMADRNADRLTRLVNDLLDLERLEAGATALARREVATAELVAQLRDVAGPAAEAAGVRLVLDVAPGTARLDADRVAQVLLNLVDNAIKFTPPGREVRLEGGVDDGPPRALRLTVRDEGRGIPEEMLGSIFERFTQVEPADATVRGGAGLGLAICRAIVEQHGGTIRAERLAERGTAFHVVLPE